MKVIVWDLDGCLFDDGWRKDHLPPPPHELCEPEQFDAYNDGCGDDQPFSFSISEIDRFATDPDYQIWFITARPVKYREITMQKISDYFTFANEALLFMRPAGDCRGSAELKKAVLSHHLSLRPDCRLVAAYDDRLDVLEAYKSLPETKAAALYYCDGTKANPIYQPPAKSVPVLLEEAINLFVQRNAVYKDNHKTFGRVMEALYPDGLELKDRQAFIEFGLFVQLISKITRHATAQKGHLDSVRDMKVYAAMLESIMGERNE